MYVSPPPSKDKTLVESIKTLCPVIETSPPASISNAPADVIVSPSISKLPVRVVNPESRVTLPVICPVTSKSPVTFAPFSSVASSREVLASPNFTGVKCLSRFLSVSRLASYP